MIIIFEKVGPDKQRWGRYDGIQILTAMASSYSIGRHRDQNIKIQTSLHTYQPLPERFFHIYLITPHIQINTALEHHEQLKHREANFEQHIGDNHTLYR